MIHSYNILSKVEMFHTYYGTNALGQINWLPSPSAIQLAKNRGLVFKPRQHSFSIYASCSVDNDLYVLDYPLQEAFSLTFYISFADNYWSNITSVGLKDRKNKWFFTNTGKLKRGEDFFSLHEEDYVSQDNQIEPVQKGVLYPLATAQQTISVYKKEHNIERFSFEIETVNEAIYLNTRTMDEGWYIIKEEDTPIKEIFITDVAVSYDAICHLTFDPSIEGNVLNNDWTWKPTSFQVKYESLKTYWEYVFPKENLEAFVGIQVVDAKQQHLFGEAIATTHDGKDMLSFRSMEPIMLSKIPRLNFQLQKNVNIPGKTVTNIINKLPTPSKEVLNRVDENGKKYSTIYINF